MQMNAQLPCRKLRHNMQRISIIYTFQNSILDHIASAGEQPSILRTPDRTFFRRLEDEQDRACQLLPEGCQRFGGSQQHRGMGIMAAGMHNSRIHRFVRQLILLPNRQSIHIGPQQNDRTAARKPLQCADYAHSEMTANIPPHRNSPFFQ
ncbi:hypothetical protein D3C81_1796630 [compost metagenome]